MSDTEIESFEYRQTSTAKRRTWADVFVSSTYIAAGLIFLIILAVGSYFILGKIPDWFFIAILGSYCLFHFYRRSKRWS